MRVLLDTDVVLDLILERQFFVGEAATLWELHQQNQLDVYLSPITTINVFYITRKIKGHEAAQQAVAKLTQGTLICPTDAQVLRHALTLAFKDFEDATQHAAAELAGLAAIITRNTKDYRSATLPVHTPHDFLQRFFPSSRSK